MTAHPRRENHADALAAVYDAIHPEVRARNDEQNPLEEWYGNGMYDVAWMGDAEDYLGVAAERRAGGDVATAVRDTLAASVMLPAQVELTDRLPEMDEENLAPETVASAGREAHVALRAAAANVASVLGLALLHPVREALATADGDVRRSADGERVSVEALRTAYLRYVFVQTAARAVPDTVRRFERAD